MPILYLLGTGAAVSDPHRTATMLAVTDETTEERSTLMVDCGGDALQRLREAGASVQNVAGLIVTHAHPDHCSGFPLFIERLWLHGHHTEIPVLGIPAALAQVERSWEAFSQITEEWDTPSIDIREVDYKPEAVMWHDPTWKVTSRPVDHGIDNIGVRFEHVPSGRVIAYSCDTEPCEAVVELGRDADLLVHEATGETEGHSSAVQAAEAAKKAGAKRLILVHLPDGDKVDDLRAAQEIFPATELGTELGRYDI
ncbi:MBL fold metallo-hydrolase [Longibacter salinarum]|uniref:MBL fold metallo-hydrolase n=1 Tax=Longibacter salinarum TaxID=1850348 RepID=A0A2A8D053_9BACT|nr:MBL fold metallo-hydrolase [Longibacter salinarum]PEN14038.1 MBL fold metallo-hydrolase [Longibacter salinarum]